MSEPQQPVPTELSAKAKALATPLRWRILRLALHEPKTNREFADQLGINPGTMLHHVRSLVSAGFLEATDPRTGARGAKEIPYRATGLTWHGSEAPLVGPVLIETFLQEIQGVSPADLDISRVGVRLTPESTDAVRRRMYDLLHWIREQDDPTGTPMSIMLAAHPDVQQRGPAGSEH